MASDLGSDSKSSDKKTDGSNKAKLWLETVEKTGESSEFSRKHFRHIVGRLPVQTMKQIVLGLHGKPPATKNIGHKTYQADRSSFVHPLSILLFQRCSNEYGIDKGQKTLQSLVGSSSF